MEIKYGEGIEFECDDGQTADVASISIDKEEALRQIMRHEFRAPVGPSHLATLTIGGTTFTVFNLSVKGVGIYLNQPNQFEEQAKFQEMTFTINGQGFAVDGTVVHLSFDGAHFLCGIELTRIPAECQDVILDFLQKSRSVLFS